jgi:hypothetical protein
MMGLVRRMGSWLSDRRGVAWRAVALATVLCALAVPAVCAAQAVSASDRDARETLLRLADEAAAKGLPSAPLANKIQEGLAKGVDPKRIEGVIRQMTAHLETADRMIREIEPSAAVASRESSVTLMAESFGSGVTPDQVRDLRRLSQPPAPGKPAATADTIASAARGLSLIEEARLPVPEGTAVMAEAVKQGYRSNEILGVAREVRRHEADYRAGRASLAALRDAIARGSRPDQLFRDTRTAPVERPAASSRPDAPVERPATRPEAPQRPEQPARPQTERPAR